MLHHLPDPGAGLRALRDVLEPRGAMQLMVYARLRPRRNLHDAGVLPAPGRQRIRGTICETRRYDSTRSRDHPISGVLRRAKDFRKPDAMADALLHPLDRAYTVPSCTPGSSGAGCCSAAGANRLRICLNAAWWRTVRTRPASPRCRRSKQHAAVELFRGTMVSHSFIAYRGDREEESRPISFAGDGWRDYVPIGLPWTVCVQERCPLAASRY